MLGFSKSFAVCLIIAAAFSFGLRNWYIGFQIVLAYAIIKIVWNILTKKR